MKSELKSMERSSSVKTKTSASMPNFDNGVHELKLGKSFKKDRASEFHTIRYDFKPASIDHSKEAILDVIEGKEINITFPNVENKGTTVFRGRKKPSQKECVLIFDHRTKTFTLERLSTNIQVKKQRQEGSSKVQKQAAKASAAQLHKKSSSSTHSTGNSSTHSTGSSSTHGTGSSSTHGTSTSSTHIVTPSPPKIKEERSMSPQYKEPFDLSPPTVPESYKPPTPELLPSSRKLSQASTNSSPGVISDSSSSASSSSSSSDSSSEEEEEQKPLKLKPKHKSPLPESPAPPKKVKRDKPQMKMKHKEPPAKAIMSQLSADLQLSDSDSD